MRTTTTTTDPDRRLAIEAVLSDLGRAVSSLRCAGSERLVRLGISMTHLHVLTLLRHHDAMPMGRLAEILDASMSSATGIIDRMEERGLVERVRVPDDRRVVLVRPTQSGLDLVDEVELVKSDIMAAAVARLDATQLDRVAAAAHDLQQAVALELSSAPERYAGLGRHDHDHVQGHLHGHGHRAQDRLPDSRTDDRQSVPDPGVASPTPGSAGA